MACCAIILVAVLAGGCSWFGGKPASRAAPRVQAAKPVTCPLCGLIPADPTFIKRRPVAVKIENDPSSRPQSGLSNADVVYEEQCEGNVTRFMAIYLDRDTNPVGPVRSARPADIDLVYPYNALFCHCGGGAPILAMVQSSGIADLDEQAWAGAYWRTHDRRAPHNLYSATARLRQAGDKSYPFSGQAGPAFKFLTDQVQVKMEKDRSAEIARAQANQAAPKPDYVPMMTVVHNLHVPYQGGCAVDYSYDPASGRFMRLVAGTPHVDRNTGGQIAADTVIVQYVTTTASGFVDVNGADTPNIGVTGSGHAQVFVRGRLIDASWQKVNRTQYTVYTDGAGREIPVKPGSTWVELVPTNMQVTFN
jgi:hypothetical protein